MATRDTLTTLDAPTLIPVATVPYVIWGDEESGFVNDLFYISSAQMVVVTVTMPPGASFSSSDRFRPFFDTHECLYVLAGKRAEGYGSRPLADARLFRRGFMGPLEVNASELEEAGLSKEAAEIWEDRTKRAVSALNRIYSGNLERQIEALEAAAGGQPQELAPNGSPRNGLPGGNGGGSESRGNGADPQDPAPNGSPGNGLPGGNGSGSESLGNRETLGTARKVSGSEHSG